MREALPLWEQCVAALVKRFLAMATEEAAGEASHHGWRRAALAVSAEVAAVGDRVAQAMLCTELVDDDTLPLFAALPGVTRLPLHKLPFLSRGALTEASALCRSLCSLNATATRVDDSFLEQLAQSQAVGTLEQLDLSLCGITNAGLAHLRPFTNLRSLVAHKCWRLDDKCTEVLAHACVGLEALDVSFVALSDALLGPLLAWVEGPAEDERHQALPGLTSLSLRETNITPRGIDRFLTERRGVEKFVRFHIPPSYIFRSLVDDDENDDEEDRIWSQWIDILVRCLTTCPLLTRLPHCLLGGELLPHIAQAADDVGKDVDTLTPRRGEKAEGKTKKKKEKREKRLLRFPQLRRLEKLRMEYNDTRSDVPSVDHLAAFIASCPSLTSFAIDTGFQGGCIPAHELALALGTLDHLLALELSGVDFDFAGGDGGAAYGPRLPLCRPPPSVVSPAFTGLAKLVVSSSQVAFAALDQLTQLPRLNKLVLELVTFTLDHDNGHSNDNDDANDSDGGDGVSVERWVERKWSETVLGLRKLRTLQWCQCTFETPRPVAMRLDVRHRKLARLDWRASDEGEPAQLVRLECPRLKRMALHLDHLRLGPGLTLAGLVAAAPLLQTLRVDVPRDNEAETDDDADADALRRAIRGLGRLHDLSLTFVGSVGDELRLRPVGQIASRSLQQLSLTHAAATTEGLRRVLEGCPRLVGLSLFDVEGVTQLNDVQHAALSTVHLANMPHLSGTLNLKGMVNLVTLLLWEVPGVTKLVVAGSQACDEVGAHHCAALAEVVVDSPSLERLGLTHNPDLASVAVVAPRLQYLCIEAAPQLRSVDPLECPLATELRLVDLPLVPQSVYEHATRHCTKLRHLVRSADQDASFAPQ